MDSDRFAGDEDDIERLTKSRVEQRLWFSLPAPVARIYQAVAELEARYPGRRFTPDGHMVGSIGEGAMPENG